MTVTAVHPQLRLLYPDFRNRLLRAIAAAEASTGLAMRITEGSRSWGRQDELYQQGRTRKGELCVCEKHPLGLTVTNAQAGHSTHPFGVAGDACFAGGNPYLRGHPEAAQKWALWGVAVRAEGLEWGGDWDGDGKKDRDDWDLPHAQCRYGMSTSDMRFFYYSGGITAVWAELDRRRGVAVGTDWQDTVLELLAQGFGKPKQERIP